MNLRQLEAFRATIESGSITGAARILNISQPSVSRLIADLERSVGFPLFLRAGRKVLATREAQRFYQAVESTFIGIARLRDLAEAIRTTAGGVVSLAVTPALSQIVMPQAVRDFSERRLDVQVMIQTRNTPAIVDALRLQQIDLGIVGRQPPYEGLEILHHVTLPYCCLFPEDHGLAGKRGRVDLAKLAGRESFVTFGGAYPDDMLNLDSDLSAGLRQNARLSAANMPVAAALVSETKALAIVDPFTAEIAVRLGGVVRRPIKQELTYHVALVARGKETLSLEARDLADALIARLRDWP
jgi:DNA-binding transcriptional LysR family regulator